MSKDFEKVLQEFPLGSTVEFEKQFFKVIGLLGPHKKGLWEGFSVALKTTENGGIALHDEYSAEMILIDSDRPLTGSWVSISLVRKVGDIYENV